MPTSKNSDHNAKLDELIQKLQEKDPQKYHKIISTLETSKTLMADRSTYGLQNKKVNAAVQKISALIDDLIKTTSPDKEQESMQAFIKANREHRQSILSYNPSPLEKLPQSMTGLILSNLTVKEKGKLVHTSSTMHSQVQPELDKTWKKKNDDELVVYVKQTYKNSRAQRDTLREILKFAATQGLSKTADYILSHLNNRAHGNTGKSLDPKASLIAFVAAAKNAHASIAGSALYEIHSQYSPIKVNDEEKNLFSAETFINNANKAKNRDEIQQHLQMAALLASKNAEQYVSEQMDDHSRQNRQDTINTILSRLDRKALEKDHALKTHVIRLCKQSIAPVLKDFIEKFIKHLDSVPVPPANKSYSEKLINNLKDITECKTNITLIKNNLMKENDASITDVDGFENQLYKTISTYRDTLIKHNNIVPLQSLNKYLGLTRDEKMDPTHFKIAIAQATHSDYFRSIEMLREAMGDLPLPSPSSGPRRR